ncbi:ArnT family glycosyltransferase [Nocardia sp. KC 131]|uniref:ArnT family glycosyltransferase n=1 Tax=Nocardia arseniciresistens TaxID=3392119 RepID=UPI00398F286C
MTNAAVTLTSADVEKTEGPDRADGRSPRWSSRTWERIGLAVLLVGTAVAYLWHITVNGMGNSFYAASVQAGSEDWKSLLFGSLDSSNFITVDKPPVSQWVMGLSGQLFGFSSASMLAPQALMAVAAVALVYGAVARVSGHGAGLLAGASLALIPVAAMMFRFNNPDAVMVLLMTAAAYCTIRALPRASAWWLALAGVALGFAFLAKMLEGLMVLPALGIAYLVAAPTGLVKRVVHLLGAALALVVSSGWYVVLTMLWPKDSRPYMAGSTNNTFMDLVLGYNGLERIQGRNGGAGRPNLPAGATPPADAYPPHGNSGFGAMGSQVGSTRLFTGEIGFEISWLIPAALLALVLVLFARGRRPRTDLVRAGAIVFGVWLIVDGVVFSYMNGGMHAYYTFAIAPAIAGLFGLGVHEMWRLRDRALGRYGCAALILASGVWGFVLLQRNAEWLPALRWVILAVTIATAVGVVATSWSALRRFSTVLIVIGVFAGLGGTSAYAVATLGQAHTGGGPSVGPAEPGRGNGYMGADIASPQLDAILRATTTRWSAAIDHSAPAAALELSSNTAVMAIGGFKNDPTPTLGEFQNYARNDEVAYYIVVKPRNPRSQEPGQDSAPATGSGRVPGPGRARGGPQGSGHSDIAEWVAANFTSTTVGNATVFDLQKRKQP